MPLGDSVVEGDPFGTDGQPVRQVLHVTTCSTNIETIQRLFIFIFQIRYKYI